MWRYKWRQLRELCVAALFFSLPSVLKGAGRQAGKQPLLARASRLQLLFLSPSRARFFASLTPFFFLVVFFFHSPRAVFYLFFLFYIVLAHTVEHVSGIEIHTRASMLSSQSAEFSIAAIVFFFYLPLSRSRFFATSSRCPRGVCARVERRGGWERAEIGVVV